jgi:hypothetical protein
MMNHLRTSRKQRGHTYKEWNDFFILAEPPTIEIGQPDLTTYNDEPPPDQPEEPHHNRNDEPHSDQPDNDEEPHPDQPEQSQHTLNDEQPPPDQPEQSHNLLNDATIPEEEQETNPQIRPARSTSTTTI